MATDTNITTDLANVAESNSGATSAVSSAETAAAGVATPTLVDDAGELQANLFQTSSLGQDQAGTMQDLMNNRQVVRDGQIVYGEKPKPIKAFNPETSNSYSESGGFGGGGRFAGGQDVPGGSGNKIVDFARRALGTPYVWGGNSIGRGLDCSGLVQQAYLAAGIKMPRLSYDQIWKGRSIKRSELRPGDLVGWDNSTRFPGADHIAIYIGGGKIIEAARPGTNVRVSGLYQPGRVYYSRIGK